MIDQSHNLKGKIEAMMMPEFEGEESKDPFDIQEGMNFKLAIRRVEDFPNYDLCTFEPQSALCDGDVAKPFGGFAERGADNTGGADGEVTVQLYEEGEVLLDVTGVVVGTLLGAEVFADDSNTFTLTPAVGVACRVGTVREYVADGKAWVHFQSAGIAGNKNRTS